MDFDKFRTEHELEYTKNRIGESQIKIFENAIGISFGNELRKYVKEYGYLACGSVEMYGINSIQMLNSDMITQTIYLHKYFPKTRKLIALENQGDGDYYLVDSNDCVFEYESESDSIIDTKLSLFQYAVTRFQENDSNQ